MKNLTFWILLFFIGCTAPKEDVKIPEHIRNLENLIVYSEDTEPNSSVELVYDLTFEVPDNIALNWFKGFPGYNWLAGIKIDDSGRVFIADHTVKMVHVFDSDGSYLTSMGQEGNGPGEYQSITDTEIFSQKLHVFDWMKFRTTTYSLDSLKVIKTKDVRPPVNMDEIDEITGWIRIPALLRSDGTYLAGFIEDWPNANVGSPKYNLGQDRPMKYYFMDKESYIFSDEIF